MNHSFLKPIFFAVLSIFFGCWSANATTIQVTITGDNLTGSLRLAVASANPGDTVAFDAVTDRIPFTLALGEIMIDKSITIMGNGPGITIVSGGNLGRIFNIADAGVVSISGMTLANGLALESGGAIRSENSSLELSNVVIADSEARGSAATQGGGGIVNIGGTLTVLNGTLIANNSATGASGSGGGILNLSGGTLIVSSSTISGNTSVRAGGGIEDNSGAGTTVVLTDVTLENNAT
ncbi:MAG: hypothetical protein KDD10_25880, partial [Phaeodactylibacter sp.]|nr:hypothetical protein [Phaeodactylibacter sp.]